MIVRVKARGGPTIRSVLESRIHSSFTVAADDLFGMGYLTREERIELSGLIGDVLTKFGESISSEYADAAVEDADAHSVVSKDVEMSSELEVKTATETPEATTTDAAVEKNGAIPWGPPPTSFSELDDLRAVKVQREAAVGSISDFMSLAGNVVEMESDVAGGIKQLAQELVSRLATKKAPAESSEDEDEEDEEDVFPFDKNANSGPDLSKDGFTVWKERDGTWRWLGTYSNKFRDDDRPVKEIIAEKAHIEFINRVNSSELEHPDLYVWHIPVPVGKADLLIYDDSGFSVSAGTFNNEKVAQALQATEMDLAMSHGMPAEFVERDRDDPSVITRYVSTEVSVLSRDAAANKRTHFSVLDKGEKNMALQPELRDKVVTMLGEDITIELELQLSEEGTKAAAEVDFKNQGTDKKETTEQADTTGSEEEVETVTDESEVAQAAGDADAQAPEGDAGDESDADAVVKLDTSELVDMFGTLKGELTEVLTGLVKNIDASNEQISGRLDALESGLGDISRDEDEKLAEKVADTNTATLAYALAKSLGGAQAESIIGNPSAHVHGNSKLAKEAPAQNDKEAGGEEPGLFFEAWRS